MINKLKNVILDFVFPARCLSCGQIGHFVCADCREKIIRIKQQGCPFCHQKTADGRSCPRCRRSHRISGVVALGFFHDPVLKKIIHQFKYNGISAAGEELAELMVPLVPEGIEIITFVPVSRRRFNERGYNQAEILARSLGRLIDRPVVKALNKVKNTERQVGLKRKERLENLRGVFVASDEGKIRGKRVLLIDDVLTTGATLDGCSSVLRDAGAKQVWGLVLARE